MLSLALPGRVFLCTLPTDMRKSFSGLVGLVEKELGQQVEAGGLFLFFSRRRNAAWRSSIVASNVALSNCHRPWPPASMRRESNSK